MSRFILLHGAWHGGWCWDNVARLLRQAGQEVGTPDLPGHGSDRTPLERITLHSYVAALQAILLEADEPAIVLGHSMAGLVITQTAEEYPERIRGLVYLTAFVPRDGETLSQLSRADPDSLLNRNRIVDRERGTMSVRPEAIREVFYADCSDEDVERARSLLVPEVSTRPVTTPVRLTPERFGHLPRAYIECSRDQAIRLPTQRRMHQATPCQWVITMDTGHSPFFAAPRELANHLLDISSSLRS